MITLSESVADSVLDSITTAIGSGASLTLYDGTRPTDPDTAISGSTALVVFTLATPPFDAASGSAINLTAGSITSTAAASGTATWGRVKTSGAVAVFDGDVGVTGDVPAPDFLVTTTAITSGGSVTLASGSLTFAP